MERERSWEAYLDWEGEICEDIRHLLACQSCELVRCFPGFIFFIISERFRQFVPQSGCLLSFRFCFGHERLLADLAVVQFVSQPSFYGTRVKTYGVRRVLDNLLDLVFIASDFMSVEPFAMVFDSQAPSNFILCTSELELRVQLIEFPREGLC